MMAQKKIVGEHVGLLRQPEDVGANEPPDRTGELFRDTVWTIFCALLMVLSNTAIKHAHFEGISETLKFILWWRALGSIIVFIPMMSTQGGSMWPPIPPQTRDKVVSTALAVTAILFFICVQTSLLYIDITKQQTLVNFEALIILLPSAWCLETKFSRMEMCAAVGAGICIVLASEPAWILTLPEDELNKTMTGISIALLAALISVTMSVLKKMATCPWYQVMVPEAYINFTMIIGSFLVFGVPNAWPSCSWGSFILIFTAVVTTLAHLFSVHIYRVSVSLPATIATYYASITIFSIATDLVLFSETATTTWFGYLMTLMTVVFIVVFNYSKHRSLGKND